MDRCYHNSVVLELKRYHDKGWLTLFWLKIDFALKVLLSRVAWLFICFWKFIFFPIFYLSICGSICSFHSWENRFFTFFRFVYCLFLCNRSLSWIWLTILTYMDLCFKFLIATILDLVLFLLKVKLINLKSDGYTVTYK